MLSMVSLARLDQLACGYALKLTTLGRSNHGKPAELLRWHGAT